MQSLPEKSHSLLNGRFKLELSFRNQITNSPSNDLKAGMYGTAVLLQNNKGIYDGRGAKCFVGSVSSNNFVVQNGIAKLKMSQQEEFLATK
jgi:hypothetical protein